MAKEIVEKRKLPEVLEHDFIICDNTLNRKGWRLLVAGIDTEGFLKNPVCVTQHHTWSTPIGKWKNIRVEGEQLKGTLEFDKNDEEAVKLYWKYQDGYMNAVSLHILPVEKSEAPVMLLPGQQYPTITKSELLEVSVVTIPGQKNAVKLSTPDGLDYKLNIINQKEISMDKKDEKNTEVEDLKKELQEQRKLNAENLVSLHAQRGVVQDGEKESLQKLAASDYGEVKKLLEARTPPEKKEETDEKKSEGKQLGEQVKEMFQNQKTETPAGGEKMSFYDMFRKDPEGLAAMRQNDPEGYKKLEADFNAEAKKMNLKAGEQI